MLILQLDSASLIWCIFYRASIGARKDIIENSKVCLFLVRYFVLFLILMFILPAGFNF